MTRRYIESELKSLPIGRVRVIAWRSVVRWSEDAYEIGTWGKKQTTFADTADALERSEVSA